MTDWMMVVRWTAVVITTTLVQVGIAPQFPLFGVVADVMLLMSIAAGVAAGPQRGAIIGFWLGFLFDLVRPGPLGVSALAYTLTAFAVGTLLVSVLTVRRTLAAMVVFVASIVGTLLFATTSQLFGQNALGSPRLWAIVFVVALINLVLSLIAVPVGRWAEGAGAIDSRTGVLSTTSALGTSSMGSSSFGSSSAGGGSVG